MKMSFVEAVKSRLFRAIVIVCTCIALPFTIDSVGDVLFVSSNSQSVANIEADLLLPRDLSQLNLGTPSAVLEQIEALGKVGSAQREFDLAFEIPLPDDASAVRYDARSDLFSFEVEGTSQDVLNGLSLLWEQQGWRGFPFGQLDGATYMKEGGMYQWMTVTCTQIGTQVCVVVHPLRV